MLNTKTFRSLLDSKGIKQAQVARITNIPRNSISRYVSGEVQPSAEKVKLLADALGVGMEALVLKEVAESSHAPKQNRKMCFCPFCGENLKGV